MTQRPAGKTLRGSADRGEVVALLGQLQQRQLAVGVAGFEQSSAPAQCASASS